MNEGSEPAYREDTHLEFQKYFYLFSMYLDNCKFSIQYNYYRHNKKSQEKLLSKTQKQGQVIAKQCVV